MEQRTCAICGALLEQGRPGYAIRKYCPGECTREANRRTALRHSRNRNPPVRRCGVCGWSFPSGRASHRLCSKTCQRGKPANSTRIYPHHCAVCKKFVGVRPTRTCSSTLCAEHRADGRRTSNRRKNLKRRGAKIGERYSLVAVAERDGWRCHLCGLKVDRRLSPTALRGPTIDHLLPVSAGGKDELVNVALAHRLCNMRRGAKGEVQLRLVG